MHNEGMWVKVTSPAPQSKEGHVRLGELEHNPSSAHTGTQMAHIPSHQAGGRLLMRGAIDHGRGEIGGRNGEFLGPMC